MEINPGDENSDLENLAGPCFDYLIEDVEELQRFMLFAGYDPASLKNALGSQEFWRALTDYFAQSESALVAMCSARDLSPGKFMSRWHRINRLE